MEKALEHKKSVLRPLTRSTNSVLSHTTRLGNVKPAFGFAGQPECPP